MQKTRCPVFRDKRAGRRFKRSDRPAERYKRRSDAHHAKAQEIYGYLPIEVQTMISDEAGIPLEKIYGVATFYSQFALQPKGKYQVSVCLGTACYVKGSGDIYNKISEILGIGNGECTPDGKFSLDSCRCVGACGLAPVMMINGEVYGRLTPDDVPGILAKYE